MAEFTKLSAVEAVETVSETANVLIEEDGVIKRVPKTAIAGSDVGNDEKVYYVSNVDASMSNGNDPWIANKEIYDVCTEAITNENPYIPNIVLLHSNGSGSSILKPISLDWSTRDGMEHVAILSYSGFNHVYMIFPDEEKLAAYWSYEMS